MDDQPMFTKETAEKRVAELINADYHDPDGDELAIVSEETIDTSYGWVFFYNSRKYLETGEFSQRLAGNGPVVFEKESGEMHRLGSYAPPNVVIREFEMNREKRSRDT